MGLLLTPSGGVMSSACPACKVPTESREVILGSGILGAPHRRTWYRRPHLAPCGLKCRGGSLSALTPIREVHDAPPLGCLVCSPDARTLAVGRRVDGDGVFEHADVNDLDAIIAAIEGEDPRPENDPSFDLYERFTADPDEEESPEVDE